MYDFSFIHDIALQYPIKADTEPCLLVVYECSCN